MERYSDRHEAGKILAEHLAHLSNDKNAIVLALPRGGVPVGYEIAAALNLPLDVFIVRKLGVPGHEELAMGALAEGGVKVFNQDVLSSLAVAQSDIDVVIASEQDELLRRVELYRGGESLPSLENKTVVLVDDGVATGATLRAAIQALRHFYIKKLIVAVPVAQIDFAETLENVDEFVCPLTPDSLQAVGLWFDDFNQTTDDEVIQLLRD